MLALFVTGSLAIFVAIFVALVAAELILKPYTAAAHFLLPIIIGIIVTLILTALGIAIAPVPGGEGAPASAEAIPNHVIDYVPDSVWWNARAPFVFARFASTFVFLVVGKAGLTLRTVVSMMLAFGSLALFLLGPSLPQGVSAYAAVASLIMALLGLLLATTSALKTIAPLVWAFSIALSVVSVAVAGISIAAVG